MHIPKTTQLLQLQQQQPARGRYRSSITANTPSHHHIHHSEQLQSAVGIGPATCLDRVGKTNGAGTHNTLVNPDTDCGRNKTRATSRKLLQTRENHTDR